MKLLLFSYGLNTIGGLQSWQHLFAHKMLERGHEITIIEAYDYSNHSSEMMFKRNWDNKIRIIKLNGPIVQRGVNKKTFMAAAAIILNFKRKINLGKFLDTERFDAVLFTDPNFTFYLNKSTLRRHNCFVQFHSSFIRFRATSFLRYILIRNRYKCFKKFLFLSRGDMVSAINKGFAEDKVGYMYNFIDEHRFLKSAGKVGFRRNQILFVGNLDNKDKQVDHLIKAFGEIEQSIRKNWKIVIVGEGQEVGKLKDIIEELELKDNIQFEGKSENPARYFLESELYVISSKFEGAPLTFIECSVAGLPVIAYRCSPFLIDMIADNKNGILVDQDDIGRLSDAIKFLIQNGDKRNLMRTNLLQLSDSLGINRGILKWEEMFLS